MSDDTIFNQLTLFAAGSPAKTSPWLEGVRALLEKDRDFGSSSIEFLKNLGRLGFLSKTSAACYPATEDEILPSSFAGWKNSVITLPDGYWTLNTSEWPRDAAVCSLSEVLETTVASKFFLSPKACRGLLRRADARGKSVRPYLRAVLEQVAQETNELKPK